MPVEPQAEKAAWLKTNKQKLIKAVKRLKYNKWPGGKIRACHLADNDILDTEGSIRMSQVSMYKIEEFV